MYGNGYESQMLLAGLGVYGVILTIMLVLMTIAWWKIFEKAGEPGWKSLIPIYGACLMYRVAMGSAWFVLLCLVPFVGYITNIVFAFMLAKRFGHGIGFGFGLLFLSPVFYTILAYDSSYYRG